MKNLHMSFLNTLHYNNGIITTLHFEIRNKLLLVVLMNNETDCSEMWPVTQHLCTFIVVGNVFITSTTIFLVPTKLRKIFRNGKLKNIQKEYQQIIAFKVTQRLAT